MSRKIIFAGPTGSGKTTAISTITDKPLVSMVVEHRGCVEASDTLVAETFNYGVLNLQDGRSVHLYEVQETQDIRNGCDVFESGQLGLAVLIDGMVKDPVSELELFLKGWDKVLVDNPMCVGVTRRESKADLGLSAYQKKLVEMGIFALVFDVDTRQSQDVKILVRSLLRLMAGRA